jgi:hypothetical protein
MNKIKYNLFTTFLAKFSVLINLSSGYLLVSECFLSNINFNIHNLFVCFVTSYYILSVCVKFFKCACQTH